MARIEESCPFPTSARAGRCESCCDDNGSITPCVIAWLAMVTDEGMAAEPVRRSVRPVQAKAA